MAPQLTAPCTPWHTEPHVCSRPHKAARGHCLCNSPRCDGTSDQETSSQKVRHNTPLDISALRAHGAWGRRETGPVRSFACAPRGQGKEGQSGHSRTHVVGVVAPLRALSKALSLSPVGHTIAVSQSATLLACGASTLMTRGATVHVGSLQSCCGGSKLTGAHQDC